MSLSSFFNSEIPTTKSFIERGYLPENVPPILSTQKMSLAYASAGDRYLVTQARTGRSASYNASKRGDQRRVFSLPHPLFQRDAGIFFQKNWDALTVHFNGSVGSESKPKKPKGIYRAVNITPQSKLPNIRLRRLASHKYCLATDVARCYPSIYTHSIPWALHGKDESKKDRAEKSKEIWGNKLDFITRQGQDGQTSGIPIGPDTSRIIAEIILTSVDRDFIQKPKKKINYVRHVDDYWIGGDSVEECEQHLNRLREGLAEYQLDINESKTKIVPLSEVVGEYWPTEYNEDMKRIFGSDYFLGSRKASRSDLQTFFSKVIDLSNKTKDDAIIKYIIRQMDQAHVWNDNWENVEPFLAHCTIQYPHCFDYVARIIVWRIKVGTSINRPLWREIIGKLATRSSQFGRDGEILWALWVYKELGYKVPSSICRQMIKTNGPIVLAFSAHLFTNGLISEKDWIRNLSHLSVGDDQFSGRLWPLTLELFHLGEAKILEDHRKPDGSWLSKPHELGLSLIDWEALPRVFLDEGEDQSGDDDHSEWDEIPDHAIEDFTSNYDDEDSEDDEEEEEDNSDYNPLDD